MRRDLDSFRSPDPASPVERRAAPSRRAIAGLRHLPVGVVLLAIVQLLLGVTALLAAGGVAPAEAGVGMGVLLRRAQGAPMVLTAAGVVALVTAVGLLGRRRWAWVVTMLYVGLVLGAELVLWLRGTPGYLMMALSVVAAFYLNQSRVKDAFATRPAADAAHDREPPIPAP